MRVVHPLSSKFPFPFAKQGESRFTIKNNKCTRLSIVCYIIFETLIRFFVCSVFLDVPASMRGRLLSLAGGSAAPSLAAPILAASFLLAATSQRSCLLS
jgi:hypothetical protein